jgi:hypothetical protein
MLFNLRSGASFSVLLQSRTASAMEHDAQLLAFSPREQRLLYDLYWELSRTGTGS